MLKFTQTMGKYGQSPSGLSPRDERLNKLEVELSPEVAMKMLIFNWLGCGADIVTLREDFIEVESDLSEGYKVTGTFSGTDEEMKELCELAYLYKNASNETYQNTNAEEVATQSEELLKEKVSSPFVISALVPHLIGGLRLRVVALRANGVTNWNTIEMCLTAPLSEVILAIKVMGTRPVSEPTPS